MIVKNKEGFPEELAFEVGVKVSIGGTKKEAYSSPRNSRSKIQGKKVQWYVGGWSVPCFGEDTEVVQFQREWGKRRRPDRLLALWILSNVSVK